MVVPFKEPSLISADTVAVIRELNSLLTALQLTFDETLWFTKAYEQKEQKLHCINVVPIPSVILLK